MRTHHTCRATLRSADDQALGHPPISAGTHGSSDLRLHPTTAGGDRDGCPGRRSPRVGNQDLSGEVERARVMYSTEPLGQRGFRRHSVSKAYTRTRLLLSPVRPCKAFANMRRYSCLFTKQCKRVMKGHNRGVVTVEYSPSQRIIVSAGFDHDVLVWSSVGGQVMKRRKRRTTNSICSPAAVPPCFIVVVCFNFLAMGRGEGSGGM